MEPDKNVPSAKDRVTGTAAVIIGLATASFGSVFLLYCLFPRHRIWRCAARKQNSHQDT